MSSDVPSSLSSLLFPWIETELHKLNVQKATYGPERGDDHRLRLFLELLAFLCTVVIQDAAILFFKYPKCPLWQFAPFDGSPFRSFAMESREALKKADLLSRVQLEKLPQEIAGMLHGTMGTYTTETTMLRAQVKQLEQTMQTISEHLGTGNNIISKSVKCAREQELEEPAKHQKVPLQTTALSNTRPTLLIDNGIRTGSQNMPPRSLAPSNSPSPSQGLIGTARSTDTTSRSGEVYCSAVFSLNVIDLRTRDTQLDHITVLESLYKPCQLRKHGFTWNESQRLWIPQYEFYLPPNGLCLSIPDIWREFREGIDGQLPVKNIEKTWGNEWRKARGSVRTELSKRMKVVNLIRELIALEGWNTDRALAFLKEHYVPTKKYPTAKSFIAALQDSKKRAEAKAKEKCKIKMDDIVDHARRIS
ncbi:hypothetical protein BDZ89DRAFT_1170682 [Hymenopellis radicata]|nr:hypothetical protein BDZ89DRAFT_1170682 [Hymenopellis radicata]